MTCFENRVVILLQVEISSIFGLRRLNDYGWFCSCQHSVDIMFPCLVLLNLVALSKFLLYSLISKCSFHLPAITETRLCRRTLFPAGLLMWLVKGLLPPLGLEEDQLGVKGCREWIFSFLLLATSSPHLPSSVLLFPRLILGYQTILYSMSLILQSLWTPGFFPLIFWRFLSDVSLPLSEATPYFNMQAGDLSNRRVSWILDLSSKIHAPWNCSSLCHTTS